MQDLSPCEDSASRMQVERELAAAYGLKDVFVVPSVPDGDLNETIAKDLLIQPLYQGTAIIISFLIPVFLTVFAAYLRQCQICNVTSYAKGRDLISEFLTHDFP